MNLSIGRVTDGPSSFRLLWVRGHCGVEETEVIDVLAKQAACLDFTGPEPVIGIHTHALQSWRMRSNTGTGRQLRLSGQNVSARTRQKARSLCSGIEAM